MQTQKENWLVRKCIFPNIDPRRLCSLGQAARQSILERCGGQQQRDNVRQFIPQIILEAHYKLSKRARDHQKQRQNPWSSSTKTDRFVMQRVQRIYSAGLCRVWHTVQQIKSRIPSDPQTYDGKVEIIIPSILPHIDPRLWIEMEWAGDIILRAYLVRHTIYFPFRFDGVFDGQFQWFVQFELNVFVIVRDPLGALR